MTCAAPSFALVTPSYALDFERCRLAVESVRRYLPEIEHHLIVSRQDRPRFAPLIAEKTKLHLEEGFVGERFLRLPGLPKWRFGWRSLPVRGWIWQQLVKLSIANHLDADVYLLLDSDCFFVRPFDPAALLRQGLVPLFREERPFYRIDRQAQAWAEVSRRLLRLPRWSQPYGVGYIGELRFWRREVLLQLQRQLSRGGDSGRWERRIARQPRFSEYALYGLFTEQVLGAERAGHYPLDRNFTHEYWSERPLSGEPLGRFAAALPPDRSLVMVSAKSHTSVAAIRRAFGFPSR